MSTRATATLPYKPSIVVQLNRNGYRTTKDILNSTPIQISEDLKISLQDALNIIRTAEEKERGNDLKPEDFASHSALNMLKKKKKNIVTFCKDIDTGLFGGGGVPVGEMTEFCGVPGVGKTQMSMQLAVNVQIPPFYGGLGGACVYIDTEGSLMVERLEEMANAMLERLKQLQQYRRKQKQRKTNGNNTNGNTNENSINGNNNTLSSSSKSSRKKRTDDIDITIESILSNIHVFRVHDYAEQLAVVKMLPTFLNDHSNVQLIVMDSVAFHFRHGFDDMAKRSRMLSQMSQDLNKMATDYELSIVVVNQVTTKFKFGNSNNNNNKNNDNITNNNNNGGGGAILIPALGESWSHAATNRVELFWNQGIRNAKLVKSPSQKVNTVTYAVTKDGIRRSSKSIVSNVDNGNSGSNSNSTNSNGGGGSTKKRSRGGD